MVLEKPSLLLGDKIKEPGIIKYIKNTQHQPIDKVTPNCRLRGIKITTLEDGNEEIITWQKNISKINNNLVYLPTIINLILDKNKKIINIELDNTFRGSKSPLCNFNYLRDTLKKEITGINFINDIKKKSKLEILKCFHLVEVLLEAYSFYRIYNYLKELNINILPYEEEVMEGYRDRDNFIITDIHKVFPDNTITSTLILYDVFKKVDFRNGIIHNILNVNTEFMINGKIELTTKLDDDLDKHRHNDYFKFLYKATLKIKQALFGDNNFAFYNTIFCPHSLIGLTIQGLGVCLTKNNPKDFINILSYLQRNNNKPICIGGIINSEEGKEYFPELDKYFAN